MFDKTITNSDEFLELPDSSQVLYFHLNMNADDDGFVNNWKSILRMTGTKENDLKILIAKAFIIPFQSGVIVIRHWRINNYLRNDRYKETNFKEEMALLKTKENGEYLLKNDNGIPMVYLDKYSIEENREDKNSIDNNILSNKIGKYHDEKVEIIDYMNLRFGTHYRYNNKKTNQLIEARLNDGYTMEEIKLVIDKKCNQWLNTDMAKYLRPETLLGNKFEGYLNENGVTLQDKLNERQGFQDLLEKGLI